MLTKVRGVVMSKNNIRFNRTMDVRDVLDLAKDGYLDQQIDDLMARRQHKIRHFDDM